jgi:23S rRNA (uridine2552-2'-O)-methyltransferase
LKRWNDDPFTKKAQKENYEARSVYKLKEIDDKEKLFRGAKIILDLGASPGSWTQYCLEKCPQAKVIAIDLNPIHITHPNLTFIEGDIETADLSSYIQDSKVDVVLSDMAPHTSGQHDRDVLASIELCEMALANADKFLKKGGNFVTKIFMGTGFEDLHKKLKSSFESSRLLKPESTRKQSREIFFIGKGFKP